MTPAGCRLCIAALALTPALAAAADLRLSTNGLGPARFGMTVAQVEKVLGVALVPEGGPPGDCRYYRVARPKIGGLRMMFVGGQVARFDVNAPGIRTLSGIGVGDTEQRILQSFGRSVEAQPHKYITPLGNYLTVWSADRRSAVRFETDRGRIISFYAGRVPEVRYAEGCS